MIDYWWVTRPKRRLDSVPEVLAAVAGETLDREWTGEVHRHLDLERALEKAGLKREGLRRDQTGGGGRTYVAWMRSLGLVFFDTDRLARLTLAGEALLRGEPPVPILTKQVLTYQFPSAFSLGRRVDVSPRFRIRPFRFLLRLLADPRIRWLDEKDIGRICATQADNESDSCYERVAALLLEQREVGWERFLIRHPEIEDYGMRSAEHSCRSFDDIGNTMMNWLDYTQLTARAARRIWIPAEQMARVLDLLASDPPFIAHPEDEERFQRRYGLDLGHKKDTRNLQGTSTVTARMILDNRIQRAFLALSLRIPITTIDAQIVARVAEAAGTEYRMTEDALQRLYPEGALGSFLSAYYRLAFGGRAAAEKFELATVSLINSVFGLEAKHIGHMGRTPDVLVIDGPDCWSGIIDNKAYAEYSVSNDHHNRMAVNYINGYRRYYDGTERLAWYSYIAGGFGRGIDGQLAAITKETAVPGSAVTAAAMVDFAQLAQNGEVSPEMFRRVMSLGRMVGITDIGHLAVPHS